MALDQDLRIAIDGKWRHVRVAARAQLAEMNLAFNHELSMDEARERTLEQIKGLVPTGIPANCSGTSVTSQIASSNCSAVSRRVVAWELYSSS